MCDLSAALQDLLREYCHAEGLDWHSVGQPFLKKLQAEAMKNADELADADMIPVAAQRKQDQCRSLSRFCFTRKDAKSQAARLAL